MSAVDYYFIQEDGSRFKVGPRGGWAGRRILLGDLPLSPVCSLLGGPALQALLLHRHPEGEEGTLGQQFPGELETSWTSWFGMVFSQGTERCRSAPVSLGRAVSERCPPSSLRSSRERLQSWRLSPKKTWTWSVSALEQQGFGTLRSSGEAGRD